MSRVIILITLGLIISACSSTPDINVSHAPAPPKSTPEHPNVTADKPKPPKTVVSGSCVAENGKVGRPYTIRGVRYTPKRDPNYSRTGLASFYGKHHHGKMTANGETFNMHGLSAAHTTLPLPSCVKVTNLENNKSIILRVNDRGPFVKGRVIDVSYAAARELDFITAGLTKVRVEVID